MRINFNSINLLVILFVVCVCGVQFASAQAQSSDARPNQSEIARKIEEYTNAAAKNLHFSGSILVARDGSTFVSKNYGMANYELNTPITPHSRFPVASITKSFTATAVMMLQERGKLSVANSICKYLENCPQAWQPITIRHLLTNTSGITNDMARFYETAPGQLNSFSGYADAFRPKSSYKQLIDEFRNEPVRSAPGERYVYSNSGYFLLGLIVERASGQPYVEFVRDNIFAHAGMKNSGFNDMAALVPNRVNGYRWTGETFINADYFNMAVAPSAGSIYSTAADLLLWANALHAGKLIARESLGEMSTTFKDDYGYGLITGKMFDRQRIAHSGGMPGFSTFFASYPAERVTIIVLGNNQNVSSQTINNNLAAIVFGEPYEQPKTPISEPLSLTVARRGIDAAVRQYRELKRAEASNYDFSEQQLNNLGYDLLAAKRIKEAIEIFKLNVETFPQAFNAYDSLAEAYMVNGEKEPAIKYYEKSLELNPQNANGIEMLKKLKGNK